MKHLCGADRGTQGAYQLGALWLSYVCPYPLEPELIALLLYFWHSSNCLTHIESSIFDSLARDTCIIQTRKLRQRLDVS